MHLHRSGIGVALIGAVAVIGLCSIALPALAAERDLDGGASLTAMGAVGTAPSLTATRAVRTPGSLTATGKVGGVSVLSDGMVARGGGPVNDNCEDVSVDDLSVGECLVYNGDLTGATMTCAAGGLPEVWHAFNLTADSDVTTSFCGTAPVFGNAYIVIDPECPCSGAFVFADAFDQAACPDGNWTMYYNGLPAGDYWTPVLYDPPSGNDGPYTWNICAGEGPPPPEVCGPGNGDCCTEGGNGTPGCDDEACCEMICAGDPFCCDVEWDGICADSAQADCAVCQGPGDGIPPGGPDNDNCEDVPVDDLAVGDCLVYNGDLTGATMTCAAGGFPEVWHAFNLLADSDVTTSFCDTSPVFGNAYIVIDPECPCSGAFVFADAFDQGSCPGGDGNWTMYYNGLPAGDYWTPVLQDPPSGNDGPYTWNICAGEGPPPPEVCGPGNGDCCTEGGNGTPGCDDEACCEMICAGDPFCCDVSWDGICADSAQADCAVCQGPGDGPGCFDNELCENAFVINNGDTVNGNSCEESLCQDGSASCGLSETSPDVWYAFTAECTGTAHAETCGSVYDTVLSVHEGCPGTIGNEIVCNDDFCALQSGVDWAITEGTTYMIRVSGFADGCGDFTLTVDKDCPPTCDPVCDDGDQCTDDVCNDDGTCSYPDNGECCPTPAECDGDVNGDGAVDPLDSGAILARFGLDPVCDEELCQYDVNCDGSIDPLDSGYVLARFGVCNPVPVCKHCPSEQVFYNTCEEAPVDTLNVGETLIYDGDNTDATMTCAAGGFPEAWHAFDLTAAADVTCAYCGTDPPFGNAYIVIDPECPCSGNFVFATNFDQNTCDDGNWAMHYDGLPAGDYWTPILQDGTSMGKYTWNISAAEGGGPPEVCGPGNGDCCSPNGSPGCDDEACCEAICAGDPFCCDVEWDGICADAAVLECDVCGGGGGPANDDCADATDLFDGVTAFDTNGATTDGDTLPEVCEKGFGLEIVNDIWYHYTATCTGTATMSTCDDASYDTRMAAYVGTTCVGDLAGCNDDGPGCGGFTTTMEVAVVAGETYKIRLGGFGGSGTGNLTVSCP